MSELSQKEIDNIIEGLSNLGNLRTITLELRMIGLQLMKLNKNLSSVKLKKENENEN